MVPWGEGWRGARSGLPPGSPPGHENVMCQPSCLHARRMRSHGQNNGLKPFDWRNLLRPGPDLGLALALLAGVAATSRQGYATQPIGEHSLCFKKLSEKGVQRSRNVYMYRDGTASLIRQI